jgi:superfamily II DNA/RNA helicase
MQNSRFKNRNSFSGGFSNQFGRPSFGKSNSRSNGSHTRPSRRPRGEFIDISKFVSKAKPGFSAPVVQIKNKFTDFGFCQKINQNLNEIGYLSPTPIQDQSMAQIIEGRDIIGLANTGTGKTAAFLLPMIDKCYRDRNQKILIIAPTRELAQQIDQEFKKFSKNMGLYSAICVGGAPIFRQISDLRRGPNFVIGTPGRLKDLKNRNNIKFAYFQNIVLDEIDRMLDMGFVDEIKLILAELPGKRQSLFFSATMPPRIEALVKQFLCNPITVKTITGETAANVDQNIVRTTGENKFDRLKELLAGQELKKVLIFSETKRDVEKLTKNLAINGFKADSIHGDKRQSQRQKALIRFKSDDIQILVATDVAARGLDINNVSHVINYTVPQTYNDYVHRIGRTGRGDKTGIALTFVE